MGQALLGGENFHRSVQGKIGKGRHREIPDRKRLEANRGEPPASLFRTVWGKRQLYVPCPSLQRRGFKIVS